MDLFRKFLTNPNYSRFQFLGSRTSSPSFAPETFSNSIHSRAESRLRLFKIYYRGRQGVPVGNSESLSDLRNCHQGLCVRSEHILPLKPKCPTIHDICWGGEWVYCLFCNHQLNLMARFTFLW